MAVPSGVIIGWAGTNAGIPAGWNRVTAMDSRFAKMIATSATAPGATGGSGSHDHPYGAHSDHTSTAHTHTYGSSSAGDGGGTVSTGGTGSVNLHTHTQTGGNSAYIIGSGGPTNFDAQTTEPPNLVVIFIKSDGTPLGIPNNGLVFFNAASPTGFTAYANAANRMWKGAAAGGDGGATGGTGDAHTHTSAGHTHTISHTHNITLNTSANDGFSGGSSGSAGPTHTHTATTSTNTDGTSGSNSEGTGNGDMTPPWYKVLCIQNTSGSDSYPKNIIALWDGALGSIPTGWALCDGTLGTPNLSNGKFVRGANGSGEVGNTGGATTHTHSGNGHTHTNPAGSHSHGSVTSSAFGGSGFVLDESDSFTTHHHTTGASGNTSANDLNSRTTAATANSSNDPTFTGLAYIQLQTALFNQALTATPSVGTATLTKLPIKVLSVSSPSTATFGKKVFLTKSVSGPGAASMSKVISTPGTTTLLVSSSSSISLAHLVKKYLTASCTGAASLQIQIGVPQDFYAASVTQFIKAVSLTQFIEAFGE